MENGSIVRVLDWKKSKSNGGGFFLKNLGALTFIEQVRYAYGDKHHITDHCTDDQSLYYVWFTDGEEALICDNEDPENSPLYLINVSALKEAA